MMKQAGAKKGAMKAVMKKMSMKMKKMASMKKRKMAVRKTIIAKGKRAKTAVFSGKKEKTVGGLKKSDLTTNKAGKVVSKKQSERAKSSKMYKRILAWAGAVKQARKSLGVKGFVAVGGKTKQGQALLTKVRSLYKK